MMDSTIIFFSREHILTHIVHQLKKGTAIAWIQTKPKQLCARWAQRCFALPQESLDQVFHPPHPTTKSTSLLYSIDRVEHAEGRMKPQKAYCLVVADILLIITVHTLFRDHHFSTQNGKDTPNPSVLNHKRYCPLHIFLFHPYLSAFVSSNVTSSLVMRWRIATPWSVSIQVCHDYTACVRPKVERVVPISVPVFAQIKRSK